MSITVLAHTAPAPAFNGLFYATAATIIPVLFLAIAVQGSGYANLLKVFDTFAKRTERARSPGRAVVSISASVVLMLIAGLILFVGIYAEIQAVYALYQQQVQSNTGPSVLSGVILLIIATAAGPALTFKRYFTGSDQPVACCQAPPQHPACTSSDAKAESGTDKTDPA